MRPRISASLSHEEAARLFTEALEFQRTRRIAVEHEAATLAQLARAQIGKGGHRDRTHVG